MASTCPRGAITLTLSTRVIETLSEMPRIARDMVEYYVYVSLVLLMAAGGMLAVAFTTRDIRGQGGFALDIASAVVVALFIAVLAWTTVL